MRYKQLPAELCGSGSWPAGPFTGGTDPAARTAAAVIARLAATMIATRERRGWSRATLATRAGVGQHTVGRIEAGRTWPDLATIVAITSALGLDLHAVPAGQPTPLLAATASAAPAASVPVPRQAPPLTVPGVTPGDGTTSAHVIEALLAHSPRLRQQVDQLTYARRTAGVRRNSTSGTRL